MPSPQLEAEPAAGYSETNRRSFQDAATRTGIVQGFYQVGTYVVLLEFAGSALVSRLTRSLAHLRTEPVEKPSLTISIWDSESTGVPMPLAPWDVEDYVARRETWGIAQGPVLVCFEFPGESGPTLNVLDREAHQAFYWVSSARGISFWENAAPLKMILHWWLRDRGLQFLHAGAVGNENGGVLLGGKGGSGKSTTTLLCVGLLQGLNGGSTYGLRYASDDYTVVNQDNPPIAYSLYNAAKLHASHLQKTMPALLPAVSNPDRMEEEKAVLYLKESCPRNLLDKLTIKAILLPTVTGRSRSELKQVSPALGVNAIAPSTLFQMRWSGQEDMSNMVGVIGRVPNYRLELGTDLQEIPELIATLLESRI